MLNTNDNNTNNANNTDIELDLDGRIPLKNLPNATHQGTLKLDGVAITVAILENGMRGISVKSLYKLFGFTRRSESAGQLPEFLSANYLQPYLSDELKELATNKIKYKCLKYNREECFDVAIVPFVAELFIQAENSKYIKQKVIDKAYRISATLYLKGMKDLVDEVLLYTKIEPELPYEIESVGDALPTDVPEADMPYGEIYVTVAVVNGVPTIKTSDIFKILGMELKSNLVDGLPIYASPTYIRKHLSPEAIEILKNPIIYRSKRNRIQKAYNVYIIDLIFRAYTKAFIAGDIKKQRIIDRYKKLRTMFIHVSILGLVSMVDEAVGYKRTKEDSYKARLNKIAGSERELLRVVKFHESFYFNLFRLLNLDYMYRYTSIPKVGEFINKFVYDTMEVDLSKQLKEARALDKDGNSKMLYNYYDTKYGAYIMQLHISEIEERMRLSRTLQGFEKSMIEHPITLTEEKVSKYMERIKYFKYVYDNVVEREFTGQHYETGFISWSCYVYHVGDIEHTIYYRPTVESRFEFDRYYTTGLYMRKELAQFFKLIVEGKLKEAHSMIEELNTLLKQCEESFSHMLSYETFRMTVDEFFKISL